MGEQGTYDIIGINIAGAVEQTSKSLSVLAAEAQGADGRLDGTETAVAGGGSGNLAVLVVSGRDSVSRDGRHLTPVVVAKGDADGAVGAERAEDTDGRVLVDVAGVRVALVDHGGARVLDVDDGAADALGGDDRVVAIADEGEGNNVCSAALRADMSVSC